PAGTLEPGAHLVGGRPEDTTIARDQGVAASVVLVEHLGHEAQVVCAVDDQTRAIVRMNPSDVLPRNGDTVRLNVAAEARHRFDSSSGARID
ncbi:MAG: TOBE domain-containing protein, partial [Actinomycetes bacterium]